MEASLPSTEQPIIAFCHCHPANGRILCFRVPDICPLCEADLDSVRLSTPPVRYPSVFVTASVSPCSIVIKPTNGTFLNAYKEGDYLHAGITSTKGAVYGFDENGIQVSKGHSSWKQCITVSMLDPYDDDIMEVWDEGLQTIAQMQDWQKGKYQEDIHNCLDFVVSFLNHIQYNITKWKKPSCVTREELCRDYIVPLTSRACTYITLYRCIQREGFLVSEVRNCSES